MSDTLLEAPEGDPDVQEYLTDQGYAPEPPAPIPTGPSGPPIQPSAPSAGAPQAGAPQAGAPVNPPPSRNARSQVPAGVTYGEARDFNIAAPPPPARGFWRDAGSRIWAATEEMGDSVVGAVGAAQQVIDASPEAKSAVTAVHHYLQNDIAQTLAKMSPARQLASKAAIFGGSDEAGNAYPSVGEAGYFNVAADRIISFLPNLLLAVTPGGIPGRIIAGLAFGAMDAGGAYNAMADQIGAMTPEQKMRAPLYAQLVGAGQSEQEATAALLHGQAVSWRMAAQFATGTAAGVSLGGVMRGGAGAAGRGLAGRAGIGAAEGAATLGGQSGADEALRQKGQQDLGQQGEFDNSKIALAAASGALGGLVVGGTFGALHNSKAPDAPRPAPEPEPPAAITGVDPALKVSMSTALMVPEGPARGGDFTIPMSGAAGSPPPPEVQTPMGAAPARPDAPSWRDLNLAPSGRPGGEPPPPPTQAPMPPPTQAPMPPPTQAPMPPPTQAPTQAAIQIMTKGRATAALVQMGENPTELSGLSVKALRSRLAALQTPTASEPAPGRPNTVPVEGGGVPADAVAPRAEVLTSPDAQPATPPAPAPTIAPAGPAAAEPAPTTVEAAPGTTASVPFMITAAMKSKLRALGLSNEEISQLTPAAAHERINAAPEAEVAPVVNPENLKAEPAAAPVEPVVNPENPTVEPVANPVAPEPPKLSKADQLKADAAAKRALQKAKLTGSVAPATDAQGKGSLKLSAEQEAKAKAAAEKVAQEVKPAAAKPPVAPEVAAPAVEERTPQAIAVDISAKAAQAARSAELPPKMVEAWVRDVARIVQGASSESDAHQKIAEWGSDKTAKAAPGSKVQRMNVADRLMKLLTGKGLNARGDMGREARREVERQGSVYESEGAARKADIEAASSREQDAARQETLDEGVKPVEGGLEVTGSKEAEETSQGVTDYSAGGEKTRSARTTDKERILGDLEHKIRNEGMSVAEAEEAYGKQVGPGRRRKYETVSHFLKERVADPAIDPTERGHIQEALDKHADPVGVGLRAIEDKSDTSKVQYHHNAMPDGIVPGASRFVRINEDSRLNDHVITALQASERNHEPHMLHDAMRAIVNHSGVKAEMRPLHELAKVLLKLAPNIEVSTPFRAFVGGAMKAGDYDRYSWKSAPHGAYHPAEGGQAAHIVLNDKSASHTAVETLLHEGLHATTFEHINKMEQVYKATGVMPPDLAALHAMRAELLAHREAAGKDLPDMTWGSIRNATATPHEILTWLLSDPTTQEFAASRQASPAFIETMKQLGFPVREPGRSIWRYLTDWVRRALGMKAPATSSEYTFLDHVMRPLQDITKRAAREAGEANLPKDPVLRSRAEPLYRAVSDTLGERGRALRDSLPDTAAIRDKTRPAELAATTTDGIVGRYKALFETAKNFTFTNPLVRLRDANEAVAHSAKAFADKYQDRAIDLAQRFMARPDQVALGRLMNDATIADAKLGVADPAANAHLKTAAQQAQLKALQARYAAMPAESRAVYTELRDLHAEIGRTERDAALTGVINRVFPDATAAQRKAFREAAGNHDKLDAFLADPDNSALAHSYGTDWGARRALVMGIGKVFATGRVSGDYFPLRRFGNYVVRYGEKGEPDYGVEMFEHRGDAEARHAELAAAQTDGLKQVSLSDTSALREITKDHPLLDQLDAALRKSPDLKDHADDIRDLANRLILQASTRSEAARVRRKGVQGASVDAARVLAQDFVATGDRIGHLEHGGERFKALSDMRLVADRLEAFGEPGEGIKARQVIHEMEQKVTAQENPGGRLASATRKANAFGYWQSLMSFSHIMTGSIEIHMNGTALLGARHGIGKTGLAVSRALAQLAPTLAGKGGANTVKAMTKGLVSADWNLAHFARDKLIAGGANAAHMNKLFSALDRAGLVDHSMVRELRRIANPSGVVLNKAARMFERFSDFMASGGHATDVMNKSAVAKAAFDLEMKRTGGNVNASVDHAVQMIRDVIPNYNLGNKPRIATSAGILGPFAAPIMQFKLYGLHMYSLMGNLVKASMHGATKEERSEARKAFALVLGTHAMMAGSFTLIGDPLRYIGGLYDFVTGADKPHDYENDLAGALSDLMGPELAAIFRRGLPQALGMDLHRRIGTTNLLEMPGLESFDKAGVGKMLGTALIGAAGEDAGVFMQGLAKVFHGDLWGGMKDIEPRPFRDVMKAIDLGSKGVTDSKGRTILGADKLSGFDIARQALGVQPSRVSEFREARFAVQQRQEEWKSARTHLEQKWLEAEPADKSAVWSEIRQWSSEHHGMGITYGQLLTAQRERRKAAAQPANRFGLRIPAKAAAGLVDAGRFAPQ